MKSPDFAWLDAPAEMAARRLLGCEILSTVGGELVRAKIAEVEAYDQCDAASHTFRGQTRRNSTMFKSAGHMYVYFTYGMHYCCNVVCGQEGFGSGVLIRAVEPIEGIEIIEKRRGLKGKNATNGPGKVAQALGIDLMLNGHFLTKEPVRLIKKDTLKESDVTTGTRVGISKAIHELRRYYITGNIYVSKK